MITRNPGYFAYFWEHLWVNWWVFAPIWWCYLHILHIFYVLYVFLLYFYHIFATFSPIFKYFDKNPSEYTLSDTVRIATHHMFCTADLSLQMTCPRSKNSFGKHIPCQLKWEVLWIFERLCECRTGCTSGKHIDAYISAYIWPIQDPKTVLESPYHASWNERLCDFLRGCVSEGEVAWVVKT